MKRLLIAGFLIITSITILAITSRPLKKEDCSQKICCMKKCKEEQSKSFKTDYIFWEPIGRLMIVTR
jgi:hypothetical protein